MSSRNRKTDLIRFARAGWFKFPGRQLHCAIDAVEFDDNRMVIYVDYHAVISPEFKYEKTFWNVDGFRIWGSSRRYVPGLDGE